MFRPCFHILFLSGVIACSSAFAEESEWSGKQSDFHGYTRYDFKVNNTDCRVVVPEKVAEGRPWIWRARFWGHEPQTDVALLEKGFHVVFCNVSNLFGSPDAVKRWDAFYEYLTTKHGFDKKVILEGMSRGGLIIYNWASANPDKVHCIYADAPVCNIRSWPGGKGDGKGAPGAWRKCLEAYGISEKESEDFKGHPIDKLKPLADAGIPLFHVVGDADTVVPVVENTAVLEKRYKELGGDITVIRKEGVGHHPHSLKDPAPIVAFMLNSMK